MKRMFNKILVALDGSEHSNKALECALDLGEKYGSDIVILTVVKTVPTAPIGYVHDPTGAPPAWIGTYLKEMRISREKLLKETLEKSKKAKQDLNISKKLVEGRPSDKIVDTAKDGNFDLIVMGSRGLGGIKEFLLGSVSDRVADDAECPVMIVK